MNEQYQQLAAKFGDHECIGVNWDCVNGFGLGDPRFSKIVYCLEPNALKPKVIRQFGGSEIGIIIKSYDEMSQALLEALINGDTMYRWFPRTGGGSAAITVTEAFTTGNWGEDPLPFTVISVMVDTDINLEDLTRLGLLS